MKMFLRGSWVDRPETIPVTNPFDDDLRDFLRFFTGRRVQLVYGREARIAAGSPATSVARNAVPIATAATR